MPAPKNAPLYQQIYDEIKDAIEKGVYAPKERIPSELELAEQYEVSRITVRRAVEELCSDGYLVKQQGRGTFVSTPHINRQFHASTLQTFTALCAGNGMKAGAHVIDRQIVPARQNEMEFFGLQKDALLLHIKRVRTADGEPIFEENIFENRYRQAPELMRLGADITLSLLLPEEAAEPFAQTLRELSAGRLVPEKVGSVFRGVLRK